jgi:hypothetical protein
MAYASQANPTSQQQPFQRQQQYQQPQQAPQQQASPYKTPDMSAYAQPRYNAYNVPRTPPKGAQANDLSGNVPANQIWGQAYNQAASQYGVPGATSFTMPGSYSSQGYNPSTGQYGQMTGGQSFDGNKAYNAINSRPAPITASATGVDGSQMPWQESMAQREAFVGNLSQRLGQYNSGELNGPVTFDPSQLIQQANNQLAQGTFYNPFSQQNAMQNPDFQRAMGNSTQYMQGDFQNPFGQQANVPTPSWSQQSYDPNAQYGQPMGDALPVPKQWDYSQPYQDNGRPIELAPVLPITPYYNRTQQPSPQTDDTGNFSSQPIAPPNAPIFYEPGSGTSPSPLRAALSEPGVAQPITPPEPGTPYNPQSGAQSLPPVPAAATPAAAPTYGEDPIAARKKAAKQKEQDAAGLQDLRSRWLNGATTGQSYKEHLGGKNFQDHTPDQMADEYTGELWKRLNDGRLSQADYNKAIAGMDTDLTQSKEKQSKLQQIDAEINKWQRATYGTWQGNGPPSSYQQHIQALQRLRGQAAAGDPSALAWNPQGVAPPAHASPTVPLSGRGNAARFGGMRRNGG